MRQYPRSRNDLSDQSADARIASVGVAAVGPGLSRTAVALRRIGAALALASFASGCVSLHASTRPGPEVWHGTLATAQSQASANHFEAADSLMVGFARSYPNSSEALETRYWRALFRLDPANPHESVPSALAELDAYLSDPRPREHVAEAAALKRVALAMDGLNHTAALALAQAKDAKGQAETKTDPGKPGDAPVPADTEIKRLKDELAKANAELERIRRRLAVPPPKPPLA